MKKKPEDYNIFDFASKQKKNIPPKKTAPLPTPKAMPEHPTEQISQEDALQMLDHLKTMQQDLAGKLEAAYIKAGLSKIEVKRFLENLNDPSLEKLENEMIELEKRVWNALGKEAQALQEKTDMNHLSKARKAKTGARRRWISTK